VHGENPWTSPLLQPLSDAEQELLRVVADPLYLGVHTWPTWNSVDLTYRKRARQEAAPVVAGLPWVQLPGLSLGAYRLLWFSDNVPAGTAPAEPSMTVGLTVAGMCRVASDFAHPTSPPESDGSGGASRCLIGDT